jgi:hypothetical protein
MKIWHVGASSHLNEVNGLNATIWMLAKEQAALGHEVSLILSGKPDKEARTMARKSNIALICVPIRRKMYDSKVLHNLLSSAPPQIVHMHNVFLPKQALLALKLKQERIPYLITPNGGVMLQTINYRKKLMKQVYSLFVERPRFRNAYAIVAVTPHEIADIRAFIPNYNGRIKAVPNPSGQYTKENKVIWKKMALKRKKIVYLGRLEVFHKGIDILLKVARLLPDFEFHLYGNKDYRTRNRLEKLISGRPKNVFFP